MKDEESSYPLPPLISAKKIHNIFNIFNLKKSTILTGLKFAPPPLIIAHLVPKAFNIFDALPFTAELFDIASLL